MSVWEKHIKIILLVLVVWNRMLKRKLNEITHDLQLSELKCGEPIESSPELICLISRDRRVSLYNKIVLKNLGDSEEEGTSLQLHDQVVSEQRPQMDSHNHDLTKLDKGNLLILSID